MKTQTAALYDVVAVGIATGKVESIFGERKTLRDAEAIVMMAVARRGVDEQFYAEVPTGKLKVGDVYAPQQARTRRMVGAKK